MENINDSIHEMISKQLKVEVGFTKLDDLDNVVLCLPNESPEHETWKKEGYKHYICLYNIYEDFKILLDIPYNDFFVVDNNDIIIAKTHNNLLDLNLSIDKYDFSCNSKDYILFDNGQIYCKLPQVKKFVVCISTDCREGNLLKKGTVYEVKKCFTQEKDFYEIILDKNSVGVFPITCFTELFF